MFWGLFNLDQNHSIRTLPVWPLLGWFWVFFAMLKIPFQFFWNIQNFVLSWKQSIWKKKACFGDFSIFGIIAVSGPYRRGLFLVDFVNFLKCWKYPSNFSETFKILFVHENNQFGKKRHVLGTFQFGPKSLYPDLTGVAIFSLILSIFWTVENTLPIFLKNSKFCSFMKTISLKKKIHVFGIFQFSAKSLYPDLTGVAFFCWFWVTCLFFEILEIPFQFFWNIQNFVLSWKQSVWRKESMFLGLFNFRQNPVSGPYRRGLFLVDFEYFLKCWKIPFQFLWNIQNFVLSWKQSVWRKKRHVLGTFQFGPKSLYPDITGVAFFWLILSIFWNLENTLPILVKHSQCFGDFSIWTKIAVSGP